MVKRKNPSTSLEAYAALDPIKVSQTMHKITETIKRLGKANYEMVAESSGMPEAKVWKRLIDCVRADLIHRTEDTKLTKSGHKSYLYAAGPAAEPAKKKERVMRGKYIVDYSRALNQVQQSLNSVEKLF